MKEESKKWLEQIIKENKESDNPLKYTMCSFEILEYLNNIESNWKELKNGLLSLYDFDEGVVSKDYLECAQDTLDKMQELESGNNE